MELRHRRHDGRAALAGQVDRGDRGQHEDGAAFAPRRGGHPDGARSRVRAPDPQRRQRLLHRRRPRAPRPRRLLLGDQHQSRPRRRRRPPQDLPAPPLPSRFLRQPRLHPRHLPSQHVQGQGDGGDAPRTVDGGGEEEEEEEEGGVPRRREGRLLPDAEAGRAGLHDAQEGVPRVGPHRRRPPRGPRRRARVGRRRGPRDGAARYHT